MGWRAECRVIEPGTTQVGPDPLGDAVADRQLRRGGFIARVEREGCGSRTGGVGMTLSLRLGRGETPGWIYSPATPGFFFTGGYCCRVATKRYFTFGGNELGGFAVRSVFSFNSDSWVSQAAIPGNGRFDLGAAATVSGVLCTAGYDIKPLNSCLNYAKISDAWDAIIDLPGAPRYAHSTSELMQTVIVCGGRDSLQTCLTQSLVFQNTAWSSVTDLPQPGRARASSTTVGERMFLTGGVTASALLLSEHLEFTLIGKAWLQRTPLPSPSRQGHAAFLAGNEQVVTGGGTPLLTTTHIYNPSGDVWRSAIPLPLPARQWAGSGQGLSEGRGFVSGGEAESGQRITNHSEYLNGVWVTQTPLPGAARKQLTGATA